MMMAPRRKEEFIQALLPLVKLERRELEALGMEKLRVIWAQLRPGKPAKMLPAGWRKLDKMSLQCLYQEKVVPFYSRQEDGHWLAWTRDRLVVELKNFQEEAGEMQEEEPKPLAPMCEACGVGMVERTNRMDGRSFWGCIRFPACKMTLPFTYDKKPMEVMQKAIKREEYQQYLRLKNKKVADDAQEHQKESMLDGEEMDGNVVRRAFRPGPRSVAGSSESWEAVPAMPDKIKVEITAEELKELREQRKANKLPSQKGPQM